MDSPCAASHGGAGAGLFGGCVVGVAEKVTVDGEESVGIQSTLLIRSRYESLKIRVEKKRQITYTQSVVFSSTFSVRRSLMALELIIL